MASVKQMAIRAGHATTRSARYALGPGADLPIARIVAFALILLMVGAVWLAFRAATAAPSPTAVDISSFDPGSVLADDSPHFLPTPVAALPADVDSGPPPPPPDDQSTPDTATSDRVKVANTGGLGAILRADPPSGKQVTALREGTVLDVIDRKTLPDGSEWLQVKTADGTQGWVYSRLVSSD
ncbi:MAG: SH3 domain-containing protein [Chloroflexi bacterium]|nr:SH3 domain-containing protein [Chloroflexota bacterium]MBV9598671.1 SH3 domain-containing protein [Chloroflexota bacterium]